MAEEPYQPLGVNVGFVSGPGNVAPAEAAARAQTGQALANVGLAAVDVGVKFGQQLLVARQATQINDAKTQLLTGFADLKAKYQNDPDYETASQRFSEDADKLVGGALGGGLSPDALAQMRLFATTHRISAEEAVRTHSYGLEQQKNVANLHRSADALQQSYLSAGSDLARAHIFEEQQRTVDAAVRGGWINAEQGYRLSSAFRGEAERAHVLRLANEHPDAAVESLSDPARYPNIDPVNRASLLQQAMHQRDAHALLTLDGMALRAPARAALTLGRASDPQTIAYIFDHGLIPQESGGRAGAVSSAGALGVAQLMPDTARAAARRMGFAQVANLSDEGLRALLLKNPDLNRRLGMNELTRLIDRFDGDIPAALAGYNAGEGNAQKPRAAAWRAAAIAKFGTDYTPEQFASVVTIGETRDYILKIYQRLGAPTNALGLSENGRLRAQRGVAAAIEGQIAQDRALLARMAADAVTQDPIADSLKGGVYVAPERIAQQRRSLGLAADAGDAHASAELRRLDLAEEQAPIMAAAYRMAPSDLAAAVAQERARAANVGAPPEDVRRLHTLETVLADMNGRMSTDSVGLAARAGAFRIESLPVNDPQSLEFARALATRNVQAKAAAEIYDGHLTPLRPAEAAALKNYWANGKPKERLALAAQFAAHFDAPNAEIAMKAVAGDDDLSLTAGVIALRRGETAEKIFHGAALLETPAVKPKISDVRMALAEVFKGEIYQPREQRRAIDAAVAVYAANRSASGALFDPSDRAGLEAALAEVTGPIVAINGKRTVLPPGLPQGEATRALTSLTAADLGDRVTPAVAENIAAHGIFSALELGGVNYVVDVGGVPVLDKTGDHLVIDLEKVLAARRARRLKDFEDPANISDVPESATLGKFGGL